jgi:hypothetical protein
MHIADLNTGTAKLIEAAEMLEEAWAEAKLYWHDEKSRDLEENHLTPIYPHVKLAIDAVNRLSDVLARAERECDE